MGTGIDLPEVGVEAAVKEIDDWAWISQHGRAGSCEEGQMLRRQAH
jgi:hypothetical protein